MTCNLSSYQILTNSILFHWLLFIPIHPSTTTTPCISFVISSFSLFFSCCNFLAFLQYILLIRTQSFVLFSFLFIHLYVPFDCCLFYSFVFSLTLHMLPFLCAFIQSLWNYIRCLVLHFRFFRSNERASTKPTVKPNKLQQLFTFLMFIVSMYLKHLVI